MKASAFRATVLVLVMMLVTLPMRAGERRIAGGFIVDLDLGPLLARAVSRIRHRHDCRITTVGYRFRGEPGQVFAYAGGTYVIESDGSTELIAARADSMRGDDPVDQFGFADREIPLPRVRPKRK